MNSAAYCFAPRDVMNEMNTFWKAKKQPKNHIEKEQRNLFFILIKAHYNGSTYNKINRFINFKRKLKNYFFVLNFDDEVFFLLFCFTFIWSRVFRILKKSCPKIFRFQTKFYLITWDVVVLLLNTLIVAVRSASWTERWLEFRIQITCGFDWFICSMGISLYETFTEWAHFLHTEQ